MPRRNNGRRDRRERHGTGMPDTSAVFGSRWVDSGPAGTHDDEFAVRTIPGERATKVYRCPGCDQTIAIGIAHLVVWPLDGHGGVDERRHWHRGCWSGRGTRSVTRKWS